MGQQPEDPTAHEIIVLSPMYHLSIHYPQGSLYADVWLGINTGSEDLLVHLSEMRRQALNTSPASEIAAEPSAASSARKDSGCAPLRLAVRRSDYGLFNCPPDRRPLEWLTAKESLFEAHSICAAHHAKFADAVAKIQARSSERLPSLAPLQRLLDDLLAANAARPGTADAPTCCVCAASPYTRLFFSML
ncbi:hypothetical protein GGI07_004744 [Coemansia sp. Benny D115]|nr:hypothetical protein GGI07_004744 [Coemansia sp. Benny D115]